ncbi:MAG: DUF4209 domain-containing protein [Candidatus Lokiarchaeota archaeon]|nr:DUF4209 domain-containing protein [Candidatus Lokiarchaeota archaeon]
MKKMDSIKKMLNEIEKNEKLNSESKILSKIISLCKQFKPESIPSNLRAEVLAFDLIENYSGRGLDWGNYFGPKSIGENKKGELIAIPPISSITPEVIKYWKQRAKNSKHPVMKTRYANLVWDFSQKILGESAGIECAKTIIDQNIILVDQEIFQRKFGVIKLKRALDVALSIKDDERIAKVLQKIIDFEDKIASDEKLGLWGFSFDYLIENKKKLLTDEQTDKIMGDLEDRLERVSGSKDSQKADPNATESAAMRLISYYRKNGKHDDVKRVLNTYKNACIEFSKKASPLISLSWLQKVHSLLLENGIKEEASEVSKYIRDAGEKSLGEMKTISTKYEMPKEKIDAYLDELTSGTLNDALVKIAYNLIPRKEDVKKQLENLARETPFISMLPKSIADSTGRTVATIGSIDNDFEGRLIDQVSENMRFDSRFLNMALDRLKENKDIDETKLLDYLSKSPLFEPSRCEIILKGLSAYFHNDHIAAITILIPEIEAALRKLLHLSGGSLYRPTRNGGLLERNLDEILRDEIVKESLGEDIILYLSTFLTDQRGWNIRNQVCHGLLPAKMYGIQVSNQIIHTLLVLALVKEKTEE